MSSITLRFLAHQLDPLSRDKIRGGTLLQWMDEAGFACGCAWARGRCVTAFISSATFAHAVRAGQLVQVEARLAYTGNSSMAPNKCFKVRAMPAPCAAVPTLAALRRTDTAALAGLASANACAALPRIAALVPGLAGRGA